MSRSGSADEPSTSCPPTCRCRSTTAPAPISTGMAVPALELESSVGPGRPRRASAPARRALHLSAHGPARTATIPDELGRDPGRARLHARSRAASATTPRSCARLGAQVAGLSSQTLEEQVELSERLGILYPVIADPELRARRRARPADVRVRGRRRCTSGVTLVFERGAIAKVFYPVFPPDRNAEEVLAWLGS